MTEPISFLSRWLSAIFFILVESEELSQEQKITLKRNFLRAKAEVTSWIFDELGETISRLRNISNMDIGKSQSQGDVNLSDTFATPARLSISREGYIYAEPISEALKICLKLYGPNLDSWPPPKQAAPRLLGASQLFINQ